MMRRGSGVNDLLDRIAAFTVVLIWMFVATACTQDAGGDASKQRTLGRQAHLVELAVAEVDSLSYSTDRTGSLRAKRQVKVFNQEEGRIVALLAHEGDRIKRGSVLARLDDRLLQAELDKTSANLRQAKLEVDRLQLLTKKKLVPQETLSRAETTLEIARAEERLLRTRLGYMTIRAPFTGRVAERHVEPGDVAPKHTHLMTVIDLSSLVTEVQISELVLPRLKIGDRVDVRIDALGDQAYPGQLLRIHPTIDPDTRRGRIEIALSPVPTGARPGQFCRVTLHTGNSDYLVVPMSALRRDERGEYVFRVDEDNRARRTPVTSGMRLIDKVEVRAGLEAGQRVVARGFVGLSDGQSVKPVDESNRGRSDGA